MADLGHAIQARAKGLALTFLMLALLSGKFSLAGVVPNLELPAFLFQFRTIFLALAAIFSVGMKPPAGDALREARFWWLMAFIVLCLLHALFLPGGPGSVAYAIDFIFLLLMLAGLPLLAQDAQDRRWGALVTLGVSLALAIYLFVSARFAEPGAAQSAVSLTVLRTSFFGLAAGIYLLATQRSGQFWLYLVVAVIGFVVLSTALKASVVMIVAMILSIVLAGFASASIRRSGFYWPLMLVLAVGFTIGFAQNYSLLQVRANQALAWNQPDDVQETLGTMLWVARTLEFYDVEPSTPAATAWPGVIKPFSCLAIIDETRMTAEQFVGFEVPRDAWRCIFVDKTIRLRLYLEALQQFIASPLLGTGFGSYEVNTREFDFYTYTYPHNVLLEVLGSAGLVVFVVFCGSIIGSFWAACQALARHPEAIAAVLLLPTMFAAGLFGGDIYDFRFYFVAALLFVPWAKRRDDPLQPIRA